MPILIGIGLLLLAQSCFYFGDLHCRSRTAAVIRDVLNGFAMGLVFVPLTTIAMLKLPKEALRQCTGIST